MKQIKLKEGQKVLGEDGNLYEIEKDDILQEANSVVLEIEQDMIIIDRTFPKELAQYKGKIILNDEDYLRLEFPSYMWAKKWHDENYSNGDFEVEEYII